MSLISLPAELIICITKYLELESDVNVLSQVNLYLYRSTNCELYRRNVESWGSSALQWAAARGQTGTARHVLDEHTRSYPHIDIYTIPLYEAAKEEHVEIVQLLLDGGAEPNARAVVNDGQSALEAACFEPHESIIKLLVSRGAKINEIGEDFHSNLSLSIVAGTGHVGLVQYLLDSGADINAQGGEYGSALQAAAGADHKQVVELLLQSGADANIQNQIYDERFEENQDWYASNPLYAASEKGLIEIMRLLMSHGAVFKTEVGEHGNALQTAVEGGHKDSVKFILDSGFDVNSTGQVCAWQMDKHGGGMFWGFEESNALCAASERGDLSMVKLLLSLGANINQPGGTWGNPLRAAAAKGHEDVVEILLDQKDIDVNAYGRFLSVDDYITCSYEFENGSTIYLASKAGSLRIVRWLLDRGADVNERCGEWGTALTAASVKGHVEVVKLLLDNGAAVNEDNEWSINELVAAANCEQEEIVKLLIQAGSDVDESLEWAQKRSRCRQYADAVEMISEVLAEADLEK